MVHLDAIWIKVCFSCALIISRISYSMLIIQVLKNTMKLIWVMNGKGLRVASLDQSNPFHQNEIQWKQIIESTLL